MRYSASDKTEIIRLVEQSHLPARQTLEKLGIPRSSFYRWYDRYQRDGNAPNLDHLKRDRASHLCCGCSWRITLMIGARVCGTTEKAS